MKFSGFIKRNSKRTFVLALAALMLSSCTRCWWPEDEVTRDIAYSVIPTATQGDKPSVDTTVHLNNAAEWEALIEQFCRWAEDGNRVTFHRINTSASEFKNHNSKDAVTFSTTNRDEMRRWMAQMEDAGMTVTVTYDRNTGTWNGTAYAIAPQQPLQGGVATYVSTDYDGLGDPAVIVTIDSLNRTAYVNFDYRTYWLHLPAGVFRNIYEDDGRLVLWTGDGEGQRGDTLFVERRGGDSLYLFFAYSGTCPANHIHGCALVRAPAGLEGYHCSSPYDIILHVSPYYIDTEPRILRAQICAIGEESINCIGSIFTGCCLMKPFYTDLQGVSYELDLQYIDGTSSYISDSLGMSGRFPTSGYTDWGPLVIHDLHRYPGCASQYVFERIN